ncbi:hypothetical protein [Porphyromonas levii]|uniref:Uncharacterized protein n=2 Tax=Porphyromonas levii TaxID=28114 RepID=A0A4Y8WMB8_9PORP|nr:hypothetical protein [Porphyromonas levii]MDN4754995.1 hypothetical protein [Porphyromonadaceae bacterium W3.11]MBR8704211.1 hypothetical protein [Porphyromonas levii]MBR8728659.1 hypothetical protein [Porphyromonas levii]MBR8729349.1 hypothetical protein [Porphyromonas levii]MBR8760578.1 hypothetical protein [Porphyromonas levii]
MSTMNLSTSFLEVLREEEMVYLEGGSFMNEESRSQTNNGSGKCEGTNNADGRCSGTNNADGLCHATIEMS